jgi:hypothetical protein
MTTISHDCAREHSEHGLHLQRYTYHVRSHAATLFLLQFIVEPGFAAQAASKDDNRSRMQNWGANIMCS